MYALSKSDKADIAQDSALSALVHWIRSASQQNVDSLVKVGDCYCRLPVLLTSVSGLIPLLPADQGIGVSEEENRFEKAAGSYQSAADTQASAVAFWNLGWMYENGLGVAQVSIYCVPSTEFAILTESATGLALGEAIL